MEKYRVARGAIFCLPRSRTSFTTGLRPKKLNKEAILDFPNKSLVYKKFLLRGFPEFLEGVEYKKVEKYPKISEI